MNRIEKLINELCPKGVEYKTLDNVCKSIYSGGTPSTTRNDYYDGNIPWIRSGEIDFNIITKAERNITELGLKCSSAKWIEANSVVMAMTGATVAKSAIIEIDLTANQSVCALVPNREILNYKYLYYCLSNMYNELKSKGQGALTSLNLKIIKEVTIPVPPLEVQCEIVHVLDKFTLLTAELTAELTARKKQYGYYRDQLLDFSDTSKYLNVEWKKLGQVATIVRGNGMSKSDFVEEGFPCIHYGQIYTKFNLFTTNTLTFVSEELAMKLQKVHTNDIVMAVTSENIEDVCKSVAWLGDYDIVTGGHTAIIRHKLHPKYLSYFFQTKFFQKQKEKLAHGTKVIEVTPDRLNDIIVPVPSMEEQIRIVKVLDKFNLLCTDLTNGLPGEIEARRKQYEFYREKLLTFTEDALHLSKQASKQASKARTIVHWYNLNDVCVIKNGRDYKHLNEGKIPVYGSGGIMTYVDKSMFNKPSVLIPRKGSLSNLFYVEEPFWNVDTIFHTDINDNIIRPKYLYYYLQICNLETLNTAGGVPSLTQTVLNTVRIPTPSLDEQDRIIDILDRFDKLCNDLTIGLPAEIEMRKKQYEYYRDKLLSFK